MMNLTQTFSRAFRHIRRHKSPGALMLAVLLSVAQVQGAMAAIVNDAVATGSYDGSFVTSDISSQLVPVIDAAPAMEVTKTGTLSDDDGTPGVSAGDTITYTVTVENTGNVSMASVVVDDPLIPLTYDSGDLNVDDILDVGETWTYVGTYTLTQDDIDTNGGGDGTIDNTVSVTTDRIPTPVVADHQIPINPDANFSLVKVGAYQDSDSIPGLSAGDTIQYTITLENTGVVSLTGVTASDEITQGARTIPLALGPPTETILTDDILQVGEQWTYSPVYTITQDDIDNGGDMVNTVTVDTDQTAPRDASDTRPFTPIIFPSYTMAKSASLGDLDGDNRADEGEVITYTFTFVNTGNVTLRRLRPIDPLAGLSPIACNADLNADGAIDLLLPGQTETCSATYTVTLTDVANGSVENVSTSTAFGPDDVTPVVEDDSANDNETITFTDTQSSLEITKSVGAITRILPAIYQFTYTIDVINEGTVPETNIRVTDDLGAAIAAPATLLGTPAISAAGFSGTGGANTAYDGLVITDLLTPGAELLPGATGTIMITLTVDTKSQSFSATNVATVVSDLNPAPLPSDDRSQTPGNPNDRQPTIVVILDEDGDGSRDDDESGGDRDGDGNPNENDYDPTGHLYCGPSGQILTGGQITVTNLATGGSQTGVGFSNSINILRDGADGRYQFYVTQPGRYRLSVSTLPGGAPLSTDRLPTAPVLDVTSLLPANPGILGSGTDAGVTQLTDGSEGANPYYFDFDIETGDPSVFNNNIPFMGCGAPQLALSKTVIDGPELLGDGRHAVTYQMVVENTGTGDAANVQMMDDLDAAFGAGNHQVDQLSLAQPPSTQTPILNAGFNGSSSTNIFNAIVPLPVDGVIAVNLRVIVDVDPGSYTNTVRVTGEDAFIGLAITPVEDDAIVRIDAPTPGEELIVQKTTRVGSARIGDVIPYEIKVTNPTATARGVVDVVDFMPAGFTYIEGSSSIDGARVEPIVAARELRWTGQTIPANGQIVVRLSLRVGAGTPGTEFTNSAWIEDPVTRRRISNISKVTVRLEIEPVFQCSDLIGRVFDDLDGDGYHDEGEPGLAGVRLASVNGLLITTDAFGRYHVACDAIPDAQIGSNYILKLDERTLPTGYRLTSENPRVVRLTRGKLTKLNFAAANLRVVRLGLQSKSFRQGSVRLTRTVLQDVASILSVLDEEPAVLKITLDAGSADDALARKRIKAVETLIMRAWKAKQRPYRLQVEALLKR